MHPLCLVCIQFKSSTALCCLWMLTSAICSGWTDPVNLNYVADMVKKQQTAAIEQFEISHDSSSNTWHVNGSGLQRFVQMTNWRYAYPCILSVFHCTLSPIFLQSLSAWSKHCIIISVYTIMGFRGKFWFKKDQWIGISDRSILLPYFSSFFYAVFPQLIHRPTHIFVGCAAMYGHIHADSRFWMWLIDDTV